MPLARYADDVIFNYHSSTFWCATPHYEHFSPLSALWLNVVFYYSLTLDEFTVLLFLVLSRFSSQVSLRISIFVHSSVPAIPGLPIFLCNTALPLDIHPPPFWFYHYPFMWCDSSQFVIYWLHATFTLRLLSLPIYMLFSFSTDVLHHLSL